MRILIDTHIFLWLFDGSKRISADVANFLRQTSQNEFYFSAASAWEIAIKYKVGKLKLPDIPEKFVPDRMRRARMLVLPVSMAHALQVSSLPLLHKDPFDRLLVS
ncbi:type II toxin-antitoxin system VapC family toxin [soil metagenome]